MKRLSGSKQPKATPDALGRNFELRGLPIPGAKAVTSKFGKNVWIRSHLPVLKYASYIEPFAGMLGVLLQREPAYLEIVNDIDSHIINWWRWVREKPRKFNRYLEYTPWSRKQFLIAKERLLVEKGYSDSFQDAIDYTVLVMQSVHRRPRAGFGISYQQQRDAVTGWRSNLDRRLGLISKRIKNVVLECRDATEILQRTADIPNTLIYADPPYHTADAGNYTENEIDVGTLTELLLAQKGWVAISGYQNEWDHLNWEKHTLGTKTSFLVRGEMHNSLRTECLWTNYVTGDLP